MLAMGISLFDPSNALVEFNRKLHSNALYNGFQIAVNALAVFSAGAASTMKCFVAGTMILTVAGLVAIENIKAGDKVIATNPETFEVAEKTVLETYVRETTELLHLTINGDVIKTTFEHLFYAKDVGFVEAKELQVGDKLLDSKGNVLVVEDKKIKITDEPVKVYNFQVDDFHTYHVGCNGVLVHNVKYNDGSNKINKWVDEEGNIIWPPNRGFDGEPVKVTLEPGTRIDRYGYEGGTFASPVGTPYDCRSLAPGTETKPYNVYEVVKPVEALSGKIAPWFDKPGGGIQYEFSQSIKEMLEAGILKRVGS